MAMPGISLLDDIIFKMVCGTESNRPVRHVSWSSLLLVTCLVAGSALRAQSPAPGDPMESVAELPGKTVHEKLAALHARSTIPASLEAIRGWFSGRWVESTDPDFVKGCLLGIEEVDPLSDEGHKGGKVSILSTWSDRERARWDGALSADLDRCREMLRKGPRHETISLDPAENAAVIRGFHPSGTFRYSYSIRLAGAVVVMRFDYEKRKTCYGYFFRKLPGP